MRNAALTVLCAGLVVLASCAVQPTDPATASAAAATVVQRDARGQPIPPIARQEAFVVKSPHGERVDEYYWIRDDNPQQKRPEVMAHLRAEQAYTEAMLERQQPQIGRAHV